MLERASTYTDLQSLEKIKVMKDDKQALTQVAKKFEGIFLNMMLKSMRAANEAFSKDSMLSSDDVKFYQNMLDNQLSLSLSEGEGMGLAKILVRQLSASSDPIPSVSSPTVSNRIAESKINEKPKINEKSKIIEQPKRNEKPVISEEKLGLAYGVKVSEHIVEIPDTASDNTQFSSPQEFIDRMLPIATKVSEKFNVDPRLLVAQAALESGWGQHQIEHKKGEPSFNLFGIKANNGWTGDQVEVQTTEFIDGKKTQQNANFRSYSSYEESFEDYLQFINNNARYHNANEHASNPARYINELQKAGYATDPNYADKVMRIFSSDEIQSASTRELDNTLSVRG